MEQRTLGQQGLTTSAIGYGSMGISMAYGDGDESEGVAAIQKAHELGVTLFDTADLYGWGENEKVVGRAVKSFRDEVAIATKFGFTRDNGFDSRPEHIRDVVENSLRFLGVDYIDVLYQHRMDPDVPIEDVAGTVKEFVDAGKVKYFGLCEVGPKTLRRAHAVQPVSVLQTEFNIFDPDVQTLFPALDELGIGLVPYSPLARGFLTGTAKPAAEYAETDVRHTAERWQPGNFEKNIEATKQLEELAATKDATLSQLSLAWILAQGEHIVPIPGSRSAKRVKENIDSADLILTAADLDRIKEILPHGAHGSRALSGITDHWE